MQYIRRFRMEIDFAAVRLPGKSLPADYRWVSWNRDTLERHASVKHGSFCDELDARVFPSLGDVEGCRRLMVEIARQKSFMPQATWLIAYRDDVTGLPVDCGTIQGIARSRIMGAVQNVGVVPAHRGVGLGRALVLKSLHGFREAGLRRAYLEVTAENRPAVELYRSIGFRLMRTMYKPIEPELLTV